MINKKKKLFVYVRLTAANTDWVQAGALHTCVVHPGITH